jgi:DNA-binding transcriptional LysR family regulator
MDTLCDICRSIAWDDIPSFPEELYDRIPSGHNYFQYLHRKPKVRLEEPLGTRHHGSLEALRHAAAQGCGLCVLVEHQVDGLLSELERLGQPRRYYDNVQPQFDLWLIKRPDGADGVWVLSNSTWQPGQWVVVVAAVAFCAEEGERFPVPTVLDPNADLL